MAIDVKKERRLNDMNALAESIKLGTELRRMDESIPTAEDMAEWNGAVEDLGEFYKGEVDYSELYTTFEEGVYTFNTLSGSTEFNSLLIVTARTLAGAETVWQTIFGEGETTTRKHSNGSWKTEEYYAMLSDLTPILSDITKLKTNHTTITTPTEGQMAWNATTKKPVWYKGTAWIYADGTEV